MAERKQIVRAASMTYDEGYAYVRSLEDHKLSDMLAEYMCRIESYTCEPTKSGVQVTVRMMFPDIGDIHEIRSLAWFVMKAMHQSLYKETIMVLKRDEGWDVYVQWTLYAGVRTLAQIREKRNS